MAVAHGVATEISLRRSPVRHISKMTRSIAHSPRRGIGSLAYSLPGSERIAPGETEHFDCHGVLIQPVPDGEGGGGRSGVEGKFAEDMRDVPVDGAMTDTERGGDFAVR